MLQSERKNKIIPMAIGIVFLVITHGIQAQNLCTKENGLDVNYIQAFYNK
jgi:hypothetical protein